MTTKIVLLLFIMFLFASVAQAQTCAEGFKLETDGQGHYQCRNPVCDMGLNMYGYAIDHGQTVDSGLLKDMDGRPRPQGKDAAGNWVGWSAGAYQCPPDPLGIHPNPLWPQDQYTPNSPRFLRGILVTYRVD